MMRLLTYSYDSKYMPAMPIVEFTIQNHQGSVSLELTGLVDSGSDSTMIPVRFLKQIGARRARKRNVRGVAGFSYTVDTYKVWVQIGDYRVYLNVIGDTRNEQPIIGRDVLNDLVVKLNGLAHMTEIEM